MTTAYTPVTEAARSIRANIKQAAEDGSLGKLPAGIQFSVRSHKASLSRKVTVSIQNVPREWWDDKNGRAGVSAAAWDLAWTLRGIIGRHWKCNSSSTFGFVDLDGQILVAA
jgi:hypothetical protein